MASNRKKKYATGKSKQHVHPLRRRETGETSKDQKKTDKNTPIFQLGRRDGRGIQLSNRGVFNGKKGGKRGKAALTRPRSRRKQGKAQYGRGTISKKSQRRREKE